MSKHGKKQISVKTTDKQTIDQKTNDSFSNLVARLGNQFPRSEEHTSELQSQR